MIRGLYTSALGMKNNEKRMEVLSNNLANVNTAGYKKDVAVTSSFADVMTEIIGGNQDENQENNNIGNLTLGVGVDEVATSYTQGNITKTENPFDVAISNSDLAFFCIDINNKLTNQSKEMYTRDGGFTLNSLGQLSTKDGNLVKGENGPIVLKGKDITINSDGTVVQDGQKVDKLLIKEFSNSKELKKVGDNLISAIDNAKTKEFSGQIIQAAVEESNVNSINEMVDMINVMRSYETNQKVLKAHDDTLSKAVSEVGRV